MGSPFLAQFSFGPSRNPRPTPIIIERHQAKTQNLQPFMGNPAAIAETTANNTETPRIVHTFVNPPFALRVMVVSFLEAVFRLSCIRIQ